MHHHNLNHPILRGNGVVNQANHNNVDNLGNVANNLDNHEQNENAEDAQPMPLIGNQNDGTECCAFLRLPEL